eukprot:165372-Rhodomonas_salina.4
MAYANTIRHVSTGQCMAQAKADRTTTRYLSPACRVAHSHITARYLTTRHGSSYSHDTLAQYRTACRGHIPLYAMSHDACYAMPHNPPELGPCP